MKKIAVLYSNLSGYSAACQRALKERAGAELLVVHWPVVAEAPFSEEVYGHIDHRYSRDQYNATGIMTLVNDFKPDLLIISGWMDKAYLKAARHQKQKGVPVVAGSDTQWTGRLRQRVATRIAPWYLHPAIDIMWVTGERQRNLAHKLGYDAGHCWTGYYSCDWEKFAAYPSQPKEKAFLYTGRYIDRKGIKSLLDAYASYRHQAQNPWELWTVGTGVWSDEIRRTEGATDWGFLQPDDLPRLMKQASAFVLPSLYEPWGVALHEAATAGLPLLATPSCGASVHLLREGFNGFSFEAGNAEQLKDKLLRMSALSVESLRQFGANSYALSGQYTPAIWADTVIDNLGWR